MQRFSWSRWLRSLFQARPTTERRRQRPGRQGRPRSVHLEQLEDRLSPAITFTWTGAVSANWSNAGNWSTSTGQHIPPSGLASEVDNLVFPLAATTYSTNNDLSSGAVINSIAIAGSGYSLAGNQITLGSSASNGGFVNVSNNANTDSISLNMQLGNTGGSQQIFTVSNGGVLTVSGHISGSSSSQLAKEGAGQLILSASNTGFSGATLVDTNGGVLTITDPNALGGSAASATVLVGSQLQVQNVTGTINTPLTLNGQGPTNTGALLNVAGNNTWGGSILLDSNTYLGSSAGTLNITGQVSDGGAGRSLVKVGAGQVTLSSANTYRGTTTVNNGILAIGNAAALGLTDGTAATETLVNTTQFNGSGTLQLNDPMGVGFTVANDMLVLNGSGSAGQGALDSVNGNNTWAGKVVLGTALGQGTIAIGVESQGTPIAMPTNLTITGTVSDPAGTGNANSLNKVGTGRLILPNVNTYGGSTSVTNGILTAEDSQALGPKTKTNGVSVNVGAALELQLRNNGIPDSVTGANNALKFALPLSIWGNGINNTGALHSISGINSWTGAISLTFTAAIGVEPDPNASSTNAYFTSDYSLTATNVSGGNLVKVDNGQLILPANNTYTGTTDIKQGWITAQNQNSLGALTPNEDQILEPAVTVESGASLMILPLGDVPNPITGLYPNIPADPTSLVLPNNFILAGTGFTHPFAGISQQGALISLAGNNTFSGFFYFNGVAGIGVQQSYPNPPSGIPLSQLTLTGSMADTAPVPAGGGGITKLGTQRLILEGDGTYTGPVDIKSGVLLAQNSTALGAGGSSTTVEVGAALELANDIFQDNGGVQSGLEIWNEHLILNGTGNATFGDGPLAILSSDQPATSPLNDAIVPSDEMWRGPVTLGNNMTFNVATNTRLTLLGNIDDATNPSSSGSSLTLTGGGELDLAGNNTYRGTTYIQQGVLGVLSSQALGATGISEVQTVTVAPGTASFALTFNGQTTATIPYTGTAADAGVIQTALNNLSTIGGGAADLGGSVTVTQTGTGVFTVAFGGTLVGFQQTLLTGSTGITTAEVTAGAGGAVVSSGASIQLQGSVTIAGEPLILQGSGDGTAPAVPLQWFPLGPADAANGQTAGSNSVAGRVTGIVADPTDPNIIYISTAGGGAWKTVNNGLTWRPIFDSLPDVQQVAVTVTSGTYTLTFGGQTTSALAYNATAAQIQAALQALSTIGGVGGYVSVTQTASGVFSVFFGGTLSGYTEAVMTATPTATTGSVTVTTLQTGLAPEFAMFVGSITMDPNNTQILYLGTGETNNSTDSYYGTGVYESKDAGNTWSLVTGPPNQIVTVTGVGTFTLSFGTPSQTTAALANNATAAQVQAALNGLSSIGGVGGSTTVTLSGTSEVQTVTTSGNGGTFTLTFGTQTTAALAFGSSAATVQAALDALTSIGPSGSVNVTSSGFGTIVYTITFGGSLNTGTQPLLVANGTAPTNATVAEQTKGTSVYTITFLGSLITNTTQLTAAGSAQVTTSVVETAPNNPFFGKGISTILDAGNGLLYVASGDGGSGHNEVQTMTFSGFPNFATDFTISFTGADSTGTVVTDTTSIITFTGVGATDAADIQAALDALPNIGGVGGFVTVTPPSMGGGGGHGHGPPPQRGFTITFGGFLALTTLPVMTTDWPTPGPGISPPTIGVQITVPGGPLTVVNGTTGGPGVWRYQNGLWTDLTDIVSNNRQNTAGQGTFQAPTAGTGPPKTPGPDDDYRVNFPQSNATWTSLALVNGTLFAALGTGAGSVNNGVFWCGNPTSNNPVWYVGDPGSPATADARSSSEFPTGQDTGVSLGTIKISAVPGPSGTVIYAAVATPSKTLYNIYVGVFSSTFSGYDWAAVTTLPPNYMAGQGNYANAILAVNSTTVYIGGTGTNNAGANQILETTDGGTTWTNVSVDSLGNGPHIGQHAMTLDSQGRLLVGNDGGIWRFDPTTRLWTDLNGNLAISEVNSVAANPTNPNIVYAAVQSNGTQIFNNSQTWTVVDDSAGGQMGGSQIFVDPTNPNNIYTVQTWVGSDAVVRRSTNGGQSWNTILGTLSANVPLALDTINPNRLLVGGGVNAGLEESFNQGTAWTNLSPPIDVSAIGLAAYQGTFVADSNFPNVVDQGANTYDQNTIYVTDSTNIDVTKDGGESWADVSTGTNIASLGSIVSLVVDPRNRDTVYAIRSTFGSGQIYESTDAGQDWTEVGNSLGLPDVPAWSLAIDPRNDNLYVGTDIGVFELIGGTTSGNNWQLFGAGLPQVQVKSLVLNQVTNTLLAGTGRGVYEVFLDSAAANAGALRAVSGSSVWTGNIILAGPTVLGADSPATLQNGYSAAQLTITGVISDLTANGNYNLTKIGYGNVILAGANIYGGVTEIQQGILVVQNPQALGGATNGTIVDSGTTLELQSSLNNEPIQLNGDGIWYNGHNTGALRSFSNANTYNGPITLETNSTIGVDSGSSLTILAPGGITDGTNSYTLTKELTGTLVLASASTYHGNTFVNQGALNVQNANALGSGANTIQVLDGAQLQLQGTGLAVSSGYTLDLSGGGINGTGALEDVGGTTTWQGNIVLSDIPDIGPVTAPSGVVVFGVANPTDILTVAAPISDGPASGISKVGAGKLVLAKADSYKGTTQVSAGTLSIQDAGALSGTGTTDVQRITTVSSTASGTFTLSFNGQTSATAVTFGASANTVNGALASILSGLTYTVTLNTLAVTIPNGPGSSPATTTENVYVYTVTFTGAAGLVDEPTISATTTGDTAVVVSKVAHGGMGTQVSSGAALQFDLDPTNIGNSGTVTGGPIWLNGSGVGGTGSALENVSGNNSLASAVVLQTASNVGVDPGTQLTITGTIKDPSLATTAPGTLTKIGTGTLVLPNANTYRGTTVVSAGAINVRNAGALGSSSSEKQTVSVGVDAAMDVGTFTLSFNGQTTGPLSNLTTTASQLQTALNALSTINNAATVTSAAATGAVGAFAGGTIFTVSFGGALAGTSLPLLTASWSGSTTVLVNEITAGALTREMQTVTLTNPTANSTTLTLTFDGASTGALTYTGTAADAATIQTALNNLPTISNVGGSATVTQSGSAFTVTFGGSLGGLALPLLSANLNPGTATVAVSRVTAGAGGTVVQSGATLQLQGNITVSTEPLTLNGMGFNNAGALENISGFGDTLTSPVALGSNTSIGVDGASLLTVDGSVIDNNSGYGVTKFGTGVLQYGGTTSDLYTGTTAVNNGTLQLDKLGSAAAISGPLTIGDGVVSSGLTGAVSLLASNQFSSTLPVAINYDGTLNLGGFAQTLGNLSMTGGNIQLPSGSQLTLNGSVTAKSDTTHDAATISGVGTVTLVPLSPATALPITVNTGSGPIDLSVSSVLAGASGVGFTKLGAGTMQLLADNTLSGTATVTQGTVLADATTGTTLSTVVLNGGTLGGVGTVGTVTSTTGIGGTLAPGDTGSPGTLNSGPVTLNNASTFYVVLNAPDVTPTNYGTGHSILAVTGDINITSAAIAGLVGPSVAIGNSFTVITATGNIIGQFAEPSGTAPNTVFVAGEKFTVAYNAHSVVLTRALDLATVALQSSVLPSVYGQDVVFTATVTPETGAGAIPNTDKVTFDLDNNATTQVVTLVNGQATFDPAVFYTQPLSVGPHTITAVFNASGSDVNFATSSATPFTQTVNQTATTSTISASATGLVAGQSVTLTATVAPSGNTPTVAVPFQAPSGSLTWTVDGVTQTTPATLDSNGKAVLQLTNLTANVHRIDISYASDTNYKSSATTSDFLVNVAKDNVVVGVSAAPGTIYYGQSVTFTTNVSAAAPGSGTPTNMVSFYAGTVSQGNLLGTQTLAAGSATLTTSTLSAGTFPINVTYTGDSNFNTGSGSITSFTVSPDGTSTTLNQSSATTNFGQAVTFTVNVANTLSGGALPSGTATLNIDNGAHTYTATLNNGQATFTLGNLASGQHTVVAMFNGSTNFASSTSSSVTQTVVAPTTTTLSGSANPSTYGQTVTYTATVHVVAPATGTPTGLVTLVIDNVSQPSPVSLNGAGQAVFTINSLQGGSHTIVASYNGTTSFGQSSSNPLSQTVNPASSSMTLASSANPSVFGQPVTFTATLSSAGGTPTGSVNFTVNNGSPVSGTINGSGVATLILSNLPVGQNTVTASYAGNANFGGSTPASAVTQVVSQATTTTALTSSANPSSFGQSVTFTATVGSAYATPTGSVSFVVDGGTPSTGTLNGSGVATLTLSNLTVASHTVKVTYAGNTSFGSSSNQLTEVVNQATTTTTLQSSANPSSYGQSVTFSAAVSSTSGTPTGSVSFTVDSGTPSPVTLDGSGHATLTLSNLSVGSHTINVSYAANGGFGSSSATPLTQVVNQATTTTTLQSSANPSSYGQSVTFSAAVSSTGGTPTGSVSFTVDSGTPSPVTLDGSGHATLTLSNLSVGSHTINVSYAANGGFGSSSANQLTQVVNQATTGTALTSSVNPSTLGQSVTFSAAVTSSGGTPTGSVNFTVDSGTPTSGTLNSAGVATLTLSNLSFGSHTVVASYAGDSNYGSSNSTTLNQSVLDPSTTLLGSSVNPSALGQNVTFTASVGSTAGGTPGGTVTFYVDNNSTTANLNGSGVATITVNNLTAGSHTVSASYGGSTTYVASSSSSLMQMVNQASTTTSLSSTPASSTYGQAVTFTATVGTGTSGFGVPTGTVTFTIDGTQQMPAVTVNSSGVATLTTSSLSAGTPHSIFATYSGDSNFATSNDAAANFTQTVSAASTTTTVAASASPAVYGQQVTFTATVASSGGVPNTGTVTFVIDNGSGQTVSVNSQGQASVSTTFITRGSHTVVATYNGSTNFNGSSNSATPLSLTVNQANSKTTVAASPSGPSVLGQAVTFTATVAAAGPGSGSPTGSVLFTVAGVQQTTSVPLTNGQASITVSNLGLGNNNISAVYSGDSNFITSNDTATPFVQTVNPISTNMVISSTANPVLLGQSAILIATVSAVAPGSGLPTGSVTFTVDGVAQAPVAINGNGQAGIVLSSSLAMGAHSITARYNNATTTYAPTTTTFTQAVSPITTSMSLASTASTASYGQTVIVIATVAAVAPGTGIPPGSVTFSVDGVAQAPVAVNGNGQAGIVLPALSAGMHSITARYNNGTVNYAPATASLSQVVNPDSTAMSITSTANPALAGKQLIYIATVANMVPGAPVPVGSVTFSVDGVAQAPVAMTTAGQAGIVVNGLTAGNHTITARYNNGTVNYSPATASFPQVVNADVATKLAASLAGVVQTQTGFAINVQAQDAAGAAPATPYNGTVTLTVLSAPSGGVVSGPMSAAFANDVATLNGISVNAAGTYTVQLSTADGLTTQLSFNVQSRQS